MRDGKDKCVSVIYYTKKPGNVNKKQKETQKNKNMQCEAMYNAQVNEIGVADDGT